VQKRCPADRASDERLVISWFAAAPLPIVVLGGAIPGIALVAAEMRMMIRAIRRRQAQAALFPTPP
jgi:hypothetical protein